MYKAIIIKLMDLYFFCIYFLLQTTILLLRFLYSRYEHATRERTSYDHSSSRVHNPMCPKDHLLEVRKGSLYY